MKTNACAFLFCLLIWIELSFPDGLAWLVFEEVLTSGNSERLRHCCDYIGVLFFPSSDPLVTFVQLALQVAPSTYLPPE